MSYRMILKGRYALFAPLLVLLLVAIACGDDATSVPATSVPATSVPATSVPATSVPGVPPHGHAPGDDGAGRVDPGEAGQEADGGTEQLRKRDHGPPRRG